MGDGVVKERLTITVPPGSSFDSCFGGGSFSGFSPGPMTLVSSFFSETDNSSLSQLLAGGAMSSPISKTEALSFFVDDSSTSDSGGGGGDGGDEVSGYKQKRPLELMVAESPLFMVPPGFSPSGLLDSPLQSPFGMSHQQALAHVTAKAAVQLQADFQQSLGAAPTETSPDQSHSLADEILVCKSVGIVPEPVTVGTNSHEVCQSDRKTVAASLETLKHDDYSWRKYGQKQVKASEYPRSYYNCTHVGCLVKKKVGRSHDGHVTEITYKGRHHHDPSASNKRARDGSGSVQISNSHEYLQYGSQDQTSNITYTPTFIAPGDGQLSNQPSSQLHPVTSAHDGSVNVDDGNDQQNVKRRCMEEAGEAGHSSTLTTVSESRIIVQTRSDVDLLDDGYKWRKYGQKVVKGNPYPRSYYRCTYSECNVRKHVERALTDTKNVITTYEGKHNHVIPAAKNNGCKASRNSNSVPLKSQSMNAGKLTLHSGIDYESKDQILILPLAKEGEIAA